MAISGFGKGISLLAFPQDGAVDEVLTVISPAPDFEFGWEPAGGGPASTDWLEFVAQAANPGSVPAVTLYMDDGSNFNANTVAMGDLTIPMMLTENVGFGDPGTEQGGILVNGINYNAHVKINDIGGVLDATQILHRHSTVAPPILTFARTNSDTAAHLPVTLGQTLGSMIFTGWTGASGYDFGAVIDVRMAPVGTISATSSPAEIAFFTTPDLSNASLLAMIIGSDQQIYGSDVSQGTLDLRGTQNVDLGFINLNSPVIFGPYTANPLAAYGFDYSVTDNPTGAFVGGGLNFSGNITTAASTFIYESFRGAPTITTGANPGFAAYTVLQALPVLQAGSGAGHNPLNPLIVNAGAAIVNPFSGVRSTATVTGFNFGSQLRATVAGAVMNNSTWVGMVVRANWNNVAGSTVDFGTIIGVDVQAPALALFGSNGGVKRMAAFYGLQVANPTINNAFGTAPVAAIRSAINVAGGTNRYFLLNAGTAPSDMGAAHMYFDDNFGVAFGGAGVTNFDSWISWNGPGNYHRTFFFANASSLRWSNPGTNRFLFDNDGGNTSGQYNFNCFQFSFGAQAGANGNSIGQFVSGARATSVNGGWVDMSFSQAGNLTIDHTMSDVSAFNIASIGLTIGLGSITGYITSFNVGMTTSGVTGVETSAIRPTGRIHHRGVTELPPLEPAQITASVNNYSPATFNNMRQIWRITSDAAWNITGILVPTSNNPADTQWIVNAGAFNITLTHQDAASTAGNRFISPSGVNYILGPDESALLWHDPTSDRWRILWGTGA